MKSNETNMKNARARWTGLAGVVALAALSAVSCKKGETVEPSSPVTVSEFKASAGGHSGDGKTTLEGVNVYWTYGDDAKVFSDNVSDVAGKRYVAEGGFGTANTDFKAAGEAVRGNKFYAVYPHGAASGQLGGSGTSRTVTVTVPSVQTCNEAGNFANGANVMAAYTAGDNLDELVFAYQNVCGLLRLTLKGSATVKAITVKSKGGDKLSGTGTITFSETNPTDETPTTHKLGMSSGASNAVCLSCPSGVRLTGDGVQFNLVVAPCDMASGFDVSVVCEEGSFQTSTNHGNKIEAGKILGMPAVTVTAREGVFSVGDGKTVRFSKGNLYYDGLQWRFEDSQYDYRTYCNGSQVNASIGGVKCATPAGQWGLFGWSAKGSPTASLYGMSTSTSNDDYGTQPTDVLQEWGVNPIANGGGAVGWRTLSKDEWTYLINTRTGAKYAKATVCGVAGLLVFPDGVDVSDDSKAIVGGVTVNKVNVASSDASFSSNAIDAAAWVCLEAAGVVFLPCPGVRNGTLVNDVGTVGSYWSTSPGSSTASYLYFHSGGVSPSYITYRLFGRSVRLVR